MLLLVLILVLLAFGLLVVALLSGSVLWAWVSVGVSVAAAAVLLVDWLQRRSAVRAGADPAPAPVSVAAGGSTPLEPLPPREPEFEPATEVFPVVGAPPPAGGDRGDPGGRPTRFGTTPDAQQTVIMPVVQPPGSSSRPSGAEPEITPSGGFSSPSVTNSGDSPGPRAAEPAASGPGWPTPPPAPVVLPGVDVAPGSGTDRPHADRAEPAVSGGADVSPDVSRGADVPPDVSRGADVRPDVESTVVVDVSERVRREHADADPTRDPGASGGPSAASVAADPGAMVRPDPVTGSPSDSPPDVVPAVAADPEPTPPQDVPEQRGGNQDMWSIDRPDRPAGEPVDVPVAQQPVGEAPEEPHDPQAAAIVAGIEDEVVVVDEQPRYHLPGCRALVSVAVIPLPAREAVELGFTPCGWCGPDRTLAGRHRATAR